jgi:hypothetical protein
LTDYLKQSNERIIFILNYTICWYFLMNTIK